MVQIKSLKSKKPVPAIYLLLGRAYNPWYHPNSVFIRKDPHFQVHTNPKPVTRQTRYLTSNFRYRTPEWCL